MQRKIVQATTCILQIVKINTIFIHNTDENNSIVIDIHNTNKNIPLETN